MPLRGESIGTAYVRILADGSGLPQSIKDQFNDPSIDDEVEAAGAHHSKQYQKGYDEENKRNKKIEKSMVKKIENAFGAMNAKNDLLGRGFADRISDEITFALSKSGAQNDKNAREIGDRVAQKIADGVKSGGALPDLKKNLHRLIASAIRDIQHDESVYAGMQAQALQMNRKFDEQAAKSRAAVERDLQARGRLQEQALRMNKKFGDDQANEMQRQGRLQDLALKMNRDFDLSYQKAHAVAIQMNRRFDQSARGAEFGMSKFRRGINKFDKDIDHLGNRVGVVFGRESRNNFIHFFGSSVRGFVLLGNIIPKVSKLFFKVSDGIGTIGKAVGNAEGFFGKLGAGISTTVSEFGLLALAGPAVVAGLAVLIAIIGPLVSILSGLAAAVTALASSLVFAAVGAVAPLVGALAPLGAAIGVTALAFIGMDNAAKKMLKTKFAPLTKEFKGLGQVARKTLLDDIGKSADGLAPVIHNLRPLVAGVADAMGDVAKGFSKALQGPGFARFQNTMTKFLPNAVRLLGASFTNSLGGLGGIFRALTPITSQFLHWLEKITGEFSRWANSAKGQREIKDFLDKAADSAKSVGHFLRQAVVALGKLFDQGKGTGDSIFDTMSDKLGNFIDYLDSHKGAIKKWFANGEDTINGVGRVLQGIVDIFDSLDTPSNRVLGKVLLGAFASSAQAAALGISLVGEALAFTIGLVGTFASKMGGLLITLSHVKGFGWMKGIGQDLQGAGNDMKDFAQKTRNSIDLMNQLSHKKAKPSIDADDKKAKKKFKGVTDGLKGLDKQKGVPFVDANNKPALKKFTQTHAGLVKIANTKPRPTIDANKAPADRKIDNVANQLSSLNRRKAFPQVNIQTTGQAALNSALSLIRQISGTHTSHVVTHYSATGKRPVASGGVFAEQMDRFAAGGIAQSDRYKWYGKWGEAGAEAVVPLSRPLGQVDPSVRMLSAFAQGKLGARDNSRRIDMGGVQIVTPTEDPRAVVSELMNRLVAATF